MDDMKETLNTFYSHVNYSVTKMTANVPLTNTGFYSHVNYSVTKIGPRYSNSYRSFTVT